MIKVKQFVFNPFAINTYVIWDTEHRQAFVVDPGMTNAREQAEFDDYIMQNQLTVSQVVNTHLHIDHCIGNAYVVNKYGAPVAASEDDSFLGGRVREQARMFGMSFEDVRNVDSIDVPLHAGDTLKAGDVELKVLQVPGHSPGSVALYCEAGKFVIVGDALFKGAIGRTDLPGGDFNTLINSIKTQLYTLPDDTRVLSGHEGSTSIGREKLSNPYTR